MTILVLGAAPLAGEITFGHRLIIVAHGGAVHLPSPEDRPTAVWGLASSNGFTPSKLARAGSLKEFVTSGPYQKLLLRDSLKVRSRNLRRVLDFSELASEVENLSYYRILSLLLHWFSMREIVLMAQGRSQAKPWKVRKLIRSLMLSRLLSQNGTKVSQGVLAILIALQEANSTERVIVAGIELERRAYAFSMADRDLEETLRGHEGHLKADSNVLRRICALAGPDKISFISYSIDRAGLQAGHHRTEFLGH